VNSYLCTGRVREDRRTSRETLAVNVILVNKGFAGGRRRNRRHYLRLAGGATATDVRLVAFMVNDRRGWCRCRLYFLLGTNPNNSIVFALLSINPHPCHANVCYQGLLTRYAPATRAAPSAAELREERHRTNGSSRSISIANGRAGDGKTATGGVKNRCLWEDGQTTHSAFYDAPLRGRCMAGRGW